MIGAAVMIAKIATGEIEESAPPWGSSDIQTLKQLVRENTPTRVIGLKLGRTETSIRGKAQREGISLRPINRSPNKGRRRA